MIEIRPFASLGHADHGWLDARHHFSFSSYHDPARMSWGAIRVWNDDRIAAQSGFPPHAHNDMEIVTYVRSGAITHQDSMGNSGRTAAGDVQVMSAGSGVRHSEYNREDEETTLFQILASGDPADGALSINADARVMGATLKAGERIEIAIDPARHLYLVPGAPVRINGVAAGARDGAAIRGEATLTIEAGDADAELVLVDAR